MAAADIGESDEPIRRLGHRSFIPTGKLRVEPSAGDRDIVSCSRECRRLLLWPGRGTKVTANQNENSSQRKPIFQAPAASPRRAEPDDNGVEAAETEFR